MRWSWRPWWRRAIRCGTSGRSTTSASWTRWRPSDAGPKGKHKYHRENELTSIVTMKNRVRTYKDHEGPWRTIIFFRGRRGLLRIFWWCFIQTNWVDGPIFVCFLSDVAHQPGKVKGFRQKQKGLLAGRQECVFNILEAFVSAVGMGDDINAIIRTCPPPRDGESELACQVNGAILGAWVGNLATKLALAASNCALSINVDAICSAGITGLVSGLGEIAAGASLGAATCTGTPPQLTTTKISVLGDQTVRDGRRLLIGEGPVGNGVQCGVDVGMVAANIANMGLAINKAVNVNKCKASTFRVPMNVLKGIPEALCTVDIGGAVAYIGQVVTFINLIVLHCQDRLGSRQPAGGQQVASRWPAVAPCCT